MFHDLPHRNTIRLHNFDYSSSNWYYLTICTSDREHIFGDIVSHVPVGARRGSPVNSSPAYIKLNNYGKIILKTWYSLPRHHPVTLDTFQIMPNHIHGIIIINHTGEPRLAPTLGTIIGFFKSECTKQIRRFANNSSSLIWQRNYYEHIIRDEGELTHIRQYIHDNPNNWEKDSLFS